ncbi:hypothetical protein [Halovenus halobia]|uniref:hypothetical protein n=1 Tax=Halovenus halobia TaxID=3396622 RepID=UPI003F55D7BF
MSERVLLAKRHRDGRYECFRSQFADTERLLRAVSEGDAIAKLLRDDTWTTCSRWHCEDLLDDLSYLTLDLCVECAGPEVTAYLPVWTGVPAGKHDRTPANCGVLLRVDSVREYNRLRRRLRFEKAHFGEAIECGNIDATTAQKRLLARFRARIEHVSTSARHLLGDPET